MTDTIYAAQEWPSNSALIADCARLGYLNKDWKVLDPTYGKGNWWKDFCPDDLVSHDIKIDGVDFTKLPYPENYFDAIAYDPPYVCVGGRQTTGIKDFYNSYGLEKAPSSPQELQVLINDGLAECYRVLKKRGFLLAKCQDYISSGKLWIGTFYTQEFALALGLKTIDRFEYIQSKGRPQPGGRRQVHARRNNSTLFVFQK